MTQTGTPATVIGSSAAIEQGTRRRWDYYNGETNVLRFRGTATQVLAQFQAYKAVVGYNPTIDSMEFDPGRGIGELAVVKVEDGEPLYELLATEERVPVEYHPYFVTEATALTAGEILAVLRAIDAYDAADGGWNAKQTELYTLLATGQAEYVQSAYVLRETKRVSKRSVVSASYTNVNRVDSPPYTSSINSLIGDLPDGEWLKRAPLVRVIGGRRWEIVTEWWWATTWSAVLYGGTGSP